MIEEENSKSDATMLGSPHANLEVPLLCLLSFVFTKKGSRPPTVVNEKSGFGFESVFGSTKAGRRGKDE